MFLNQAPLTVRWARKKYLSKMESRFADLRRRDTSVSMLRVKQSRRRSQCQKQNREQMVNTRRQLDKLPEADVSSQDVSMVTTSMSTVQEETQIKATPANTAAADRLKQLQKWKEQKELKKEKEKRERESKRVFKTGLYQPRDPFSFAPLPPVPSAASSSREKKVNIAPPPSSRVTRSMKQPLQEPQRPLAKQHQNTRVNKVQPGVERPTRSRAAASKPSAATKTSAGCPAASGPGGRAVSTRSANRPPVTKAQAQAKDNPKARDGRTTRNIAIVNPLLPSPGEGRNCKAVSTTVQPDEHMEAEVTEPPVQEQEKTVCPPCPTPGREDGATAVSPAPEAAAPAAGSAAGSAAPSFAPDGFIFQAPAGLSAFKFDPLTPRSAEAFFTPRPSFTLPPPPVFSDEPPAEPVEPTPPKPPGCSPLRSVPTSASPHESKHDVSYFRSEMSETDRLTDLCLRWESRVEDETIPEEMRERMRTAVGQARLLMKERFNQFSGLVDDCELSRGEKVTTCTDLQGFWDMVYFQVEDINRKFDALREAEGRGWLEELKPPPRRRRAVKKTSAVTAKPTGNKAAAKSRLAAVKAAMKARQHAEKAEDTGGAVGRQEPLEGLSQLESPATPSTRRSSRLSAAVLPQTVLPQASPAPGYPSPRRVTRHSLALTQTPVPAPPAQPVHSAQKHLDYKSQQEAPHVSQKQNASLCCSPEMEVPSDEPQNQTSPNQCSEQEAVSEDLSTLSVENKPSNVINVRLCPSPCQTPAVQPPARPPSHQVPMETQPSSSPTPDVSVVEEIPGLDFERYFQPSQRCSMSPGDTVAIEMSSSIEMESPKGQPEELELSAVSSVFSPQSLQVQTAQSALLLFTPDLKDRTRLSTCPSDLMVFTPPNM
ncbi:disks large-associated protein 5 isoform X2 [Poeciliopsis prolifica]|uniref:disks large-associated protein 5 isoform X2 n=1 Tax=Poeciliopsis prolifica TaxID=188132 RepID=UPI002413E1B0|nr:disks large-associated protein 5 isoform X2 [Poeciliopsis prolifica]